MPTLTTKPSEALALHQAGDLDAAHALYQDLLCENPGDAETLYLLGSLHAQRKNWDSALPLLEQAFAEQPTQARFINNLGVVRKELRQYAEARNAYEKALALKPEYAEALNNLGDLCKAQGNSSEAAAWFRKAIEISPDYADAHNNLGLTLREMSLAGDTDNEEETDEPFREAEQHFRRALACRPDSAEYHNNLATALRHQKRLEEASESVGRALEICPDFPAAQNNLGIIRHEQGRYEDAEAQFLLALATDAAFGDARLNLGSAIQAQGRFDEAAECFRRLNEDEPQRVDARFNLALLCLLRGNREEGWDGYEWRLRAPNSPQKIYTQPSWNGEPLAGRTLLVHAEQGFGDAFQFVRYLPLIEKDGGRVIFECQPGTRDLLARGDGFDQIVERPGSNRTDGQVPHDLQIPLMSLARLFPHPAEEPPGRKPYIHPDPERVASWGKQMEEAAAAAGRSPSDLKVGILWAGNPKHANDRNRSMRLADLAPLRHVPGITLFSLQKGTPETQAQDAPAGMTLVILGGALTDFSDTAAALANLDLLITVDTSTAHLAGAMGIPTWLLTPFVPDWRWGLSRTDTPWYPAMRLFRQPRLRNWRSVMTQVLAELERLAAGSVLRRIEQAEALFAAGQIAEAKAILLTLAHSDSPHPRALNNLAVLYWNEGATEETLRCFERALEAAPTDSTILANCAAVVQTLEEQKQRRHREARKDLRVLTPDEIAEMNALDWWHRIPIGLTPEDEILYTPGHCLHAPDGTDYATTRFGLPLDMTGATVLDIGGWDGYFAFEAEKRGAAEIIVADNFPQEGRLFGTPAGLAFATRILRSKVQFLAASVFDLPQLFPDRKFDYVFYFGVLYHIDDPLTSLKIVRDLIGDGVALIETASFEKDDGGEPVWVLRHGFEGDSTNLWVPSVNGLLAGCRFAGFEKTDLVCDITTRCTVRAVNAPQKTGKDRP